MKNIDHNKKIDAQEATTLSTQGYDKIVGRRINNGYNTVREQAERGERYACVDVDNVAILEVANHFKELGYKATVDTSWGGIRLEW